MNLPPGRSATAGMARSRRPRRDDVGASLVEFAIILPVFALMLFGMIQFGLGFAGWDELRNAVQAGARLAANDEVNLSDPNCGQSDPAQNMVCEISLLIGQPLDTRPAAVDTPVPIPSTAACNMALTSCGNFSWLDGYYIFDGTEWLQIVGSNASSSAEITDSQAFAEAHQTWTCTASAGSCTQITMDDSGQNPGGLGTDNVAITIQNHLVAVCAERQVLPVTSLPGLNPVHISAISTFYQQPAGVTSLASTARRCSRCARMPEHDPLCLVSLPSAPARERMSWPTRPR